MGIYVVDIIINDLMPFLLPNLDFIMPMKIPFTNINSSFGFWFNLVSQEITITSSALFFATFKIMFIVFSVHLLQEIKVTRSLCGNVGKYEKLKITHNILGSLKKEDIQGGRSKSHIGPHLESTFNHALKEFQTQALEDETTQVHSKFLLKTIVEQHNEVFRYYQSTLEKKTFYSRNLLSTDFSIYSMTYFPKLFSVGKLLWLLTPVCSMLCCCSILLEFMLMECQRCSFHRNI